MLRALYYLLVEIRIDLFFLHREILLSCLFLLFLTDRLVLGDIGVSHERRLNLLFRSHLLHLL